MLKNMKIGSRLTVGFAILVGMLAVMFGLSLFRLGSLNHEIDDLIKDKIVKADILNNVTDQVNIIARASRNMLLMDGRQDVEKEMTTAAEARKKADEDFARLDKIITSDTGKALLKKVIDERVPFRQGSTRMEQLISEGKTAEAKTQLFTKVRPAQLAYMEAIGKLSEFQDKLVQDVGKDATAVYAATRTMLIALGVFSLVLAFLVARLITNSITRPVAMCIEAANKIAAGDTDVMLDATAKDETGALQGAMQKIVQSIQSLAADAAIHDRPEVLAGVGMEGTSFAWLQPDLPHAYVVVLEPQPCADLEIARCRVQFVPVVGAVEGALAEDGSGHLISLECDCSG